MVEYLLVSALNDAVGLRVVCQSELGFRPKALQQVLENGAGEVRAAIMPQPMSTPTAAGMIASRVGTTEPTVAPIPRWTSGMTAIHLWTKRS